LVSELIPAEIIPLVWFSCIAVTVYVFFRVFSSTLKEKFKQTNLSRKKAEGSIHTDSQIDDLINNAPRILNEINKTIAEQKAQGVSDEQMKGIYQKKQMLELVTNNAEVINIIGKPIIKKLLGFVKAI
jgi:uncharacterized protein YbcC (UPF0753/DUF2309 family)|tara:strand:+ start:723 stop:1106 length:384 start_codon:yes stop_codon:yes gene_type:complete